MYVGDAINNSRQGESHFCTVDNKHLNLDDKGHLLITQSRDGNVKEDQDQLFIGILQFYQVSNIQVRPNE